MSFIAASSVGKWPRVLMILRTRAWTLSSALVKCVGVDHAAHIGREGKDGMTCSYAWRQILTIVGNRGPMARRQRKISSCAVAETSML